MPQFERPALPPMRQLPPIFPPRGYTQFGTKIKGGGKFKYGYGPGILLKDPPLGRDLDRLDPLVGSPIKVRGLKRPVLR